MMCSMAPAALASLLFDPPEPQIVGKKTGNIATFLPFPVPASSFFWHFFFSDLLSCSLLPFGSSYLCFSICPDCRKFWLLNFLQSVLLCSSSCHEMLPGCDALGASTEQLLWVFSLHTSSKCLGQLEVRQWQLAINHEQHSQRMKNKGFLLTLIWKWVRAVVFPIPKYHLERCSKTASKSVHQMDFEHRHG